MSKEKSLYGPDNQPLREPKEQGADATALIETRLNGAVDRLREVNALDLKEVSERVYGPQIKFWRNLAVGVSLAGVGLFVLGAFTVPDMIRNKTARYIEDNLVATALTNTIDRVISNKAGVLIETQLQSVSEDIRALEGRVKVAVSNAELKQAQLAADQRSIREQQEVLDCGVHAKAGSLAHYQRLVALGKETNSLSIAARSATTEVELYFDGYRFRSYSRRVKIDRVTMQIIEAPLDEMLFTYLRDSSWSQRETAMMDLAAAKKPNTVRHICEGLLTETNLFVIAYGTKALMDITGVQFEPIDVAAVEKWWSTNKNEKTYFSPYATFVALSQYFLVAQAQAEEGVGIATSLIELEPAALFTRCFRAGCYTRLSKFDLAETDLKEVEKVMPRFRWLFLYRSYLREQQGKAHEAFNDLRTAIEISPTLKFVARNALSPEVLAQLK